MRCVNTVLLAVACSVALSCKSNSEEPACNDYTESVMPVTSDKPETVSDDGDISYMTNSNTVSKGKIESVENVAVYSQMQEQVIKLNIKDGVTVSKGSVIVVLDDERLLNQLVQARNDFEQAQYLFEEILVGQGYKKNEFDKVPEYVQSMAKVKSGYNMKEASLHQAERNYAKREITAPVSGTVTDLTIHQYDLPQGTEPLCRIFDSEHLKVVFYILESERGRISVGNKVSVTTVAYVNEVHTATVSLISPKVDDNGMIKIEAELSDCNNLIPGMTAFVNL